MTYLKPLPITCNHRLPAVRQAAITLAAGERLPVNAVEIEEAVSELAAQPFDPAEFPFVFLRAFGNKDVTLAKLRAGNSNMSDVAGAILQRNHIHLTVAPTGQVGETLLRLKASSRNATAKAKYALATDGDMLEAENLVDGATLACPFTDLPNHFGFFLPLAGITTVPEIQNNPIDIRATSRLNKLYVELIAENPDWERAERRHDLNQLMARLIFCFFAEDTDIFRSSGLFTDTVKQMSDSTNTHDVIGEIFRAMDIPTKHEGKLDGRYRLAAKVKSWADNFPYVNGGLFTGNRDVPRFSKMARAYLLQAGALNWKLINPDIFGSMIQAVADDEERGELGMHYTSVPNILKVLNPLFLDDLREKLEEAGDNARKLLNLRNRIAKIRVFDPACGSGNFLVIAYKEMRKIEAEINARRGEADLKTVIPKTNFRGIELRDFAAEIARLALIIAEFQCDVLYRGEVEARAEFLPLDRQNWITQGNALTLDWLTVCGPTDKAVRIRGETLFDDVEERINIDFENEGGETYICGNPPYVGSTWQTIEQKENLGSVFAGRTGTWKSLDYVTGWLMKAADYGTKTRASSAFVATNSICQGQQVPFLWPLIFETGHKIFFAHTSFKWSNLAAHNAGVTVVIVGISRTFAVARLFTENNDGSSVVKEVRNINPYLVAGDTVIVEKAMRPMTQVSSMDFGNKADDGGHLTLSTEQVDDMKLSPSSRSKFIKRFCGSKELINGETRFCLWVSDEELDDANSDPAIAAQIEKVRRSRLASKDAYARSLAVRAHQFKTPRRAGVSVIVTPRVSSESRPFLPVDYLSNDTIIGDRNFAIYDAPLWNMALIASRLHWVWIGTVCVRLEMRFSYSNTLGWNTFPVPTLTEGEKADLTRCAEDILLAREAHWPATIADLYEPEKMPDDLRAAHDRNDETLERIYIGRRFRNDTERLERLFEMYTEMTKGKGAA